MSEELQSKLVRFLGSEFAKPGGRQCVRVDLQSAQVGMRGDGLRTWSREEQPEAFETLSRIEHMAATILQIAEDHTDSFGAGAHRFEVRTVQLCGAQGKFAFRLFAGTNDGGQGSGGEDAPTVTGVLAQQMRHNEGFMRMMASMFQSSLGQQQRLIADLGDENEKLRKKLGEHYDELELARSRREERELAAVLAVNADKRKDEAFATLRTLGEIAARRFLTPGSGDPGESAPSEVTYIVTELAKTMTPELIQQIGALLTPQQQILFLEALRAATSAMPADAADTPAPALAAPTCAEPGGAVAPSGLAATVNDLAKTLTPDVVAKVAALLTPQQQNLFLETIRAAAAATPAAGAGASPTSTSSAAPAA